MTKIVTQDKLNELVNAEIDLGKGGAIQLIKRYCYID